MFIQIINVSLFCCVFDSGQYQDYSLGGFIILKQNRIAEIVHYLLNNPEELLALFFGHVSLLNVDDIEVEAIKNSLIKNSYGI